MAARWTFTDPAMTTDHTPALAAEGMDLGALNEAVAPSAVEPTMQHLLRLFLDTFDGEHDEYGLIEPKAPFSWETVARAAIDTVRHVLATTAPLPAPSTLEPQAQAVLANSSPMKEGRWCPDKCPITQLPFFMWLDHPDLGYVPTYGGPFDSFTIPAIEGEPTDPWHEREFRSERYDHDAGYWVEGGEPIPLLLIHESVLFALQAAADVAAPPPVAPAPAEPTQFCWLVELFERGGNSLGQYHTGFTGLNNQSRMTKDVYEARRYAKEGAEMVAQGLNAWMMLNEWRAVEHGFAAVPARNEPHEPLGARAGSSGSALGRSDARPSGSILGAEPVARYIEWLTDEDFFIWCRNWFGGDADESYIAKALRDINVRSVGLDMVEMREQVDQLARALREATEGPTFMGEPARGMEARSDETPQGARPEGRQPGAAGTRPEAGASTQPLRQPLTEAVAAELERLVSEAPISGNELARVRVLMAAEQVRLNGITTRSPKP